MFITSWTIDIRMNIQLWLLYRRYKSEWYNFWWATIQDIAACACKVWTLFGQACGQEECSQMTTTTTMMMMTDKSWLHRLATDILSWAKNWQLSPPFETARAQSELFSFQWSQWVPIRNSQIIGRYKEMSVWHQVNLMIYPPFKTASAQSELCFSIQSMRAHSKQSTNRKI